MECLDEPGAGGATPHFRTGKELRERLMAVD
jgi:hypothetical protein